MSGRLDPLHLKGEPSLSLMTGQRTKETETVEKDLIRIAVSDLKTGDPLPDPVLMISVGSESGLQTLTVWRAYMGEMHIKLKFTWTPGDLQHSRADLIGVSVGDSVYNFLLNHFGIVQKLEESVP